MATYVGVGALIIGTLISAYSVYSQSQAQAQQAQAAGIAAQRQSEYQRQLGIYALASYQAEAANARAMGEAQAAQYEMQAKIAQQAGDLKVKDTYRAGERLQSTARASIAKSGVDMTGSPLDVVLENAAAIEEEAERLRYATAVDVASAKGGAGFSRFQGEINASSIERESVMRQFGYNAAAAGYGSEAGMQFGNASRFRTAGYIGAGSSILAGTGELAYRYPRMGAK
jgi:hypothetical protein